MCLLLFSYIGQVDYSTTPEELSSLFCAAGKVARVTIPGYQHGAPQGYAYLEFETLEGKSEAIASLNGVSFKGRELKVTSQYECRFFETIDIGRCLVHQSKDVI